MNGLVVHTMDFTGYSRLNSNKDANNRSRSCGQGCESPSFTGEGRQAQVQGQEKQTAFQVASLPDSMDDPMLNAHVPYKVTAWWQTNQTNKKCQRSPALCKPPHNHLPSPYLLPQPFPKRSGHSRGFSQPQSS